MTSCRHQSQLMCQISILFPVYPRDQVGRKPRSKRVSEFMLFFFSVLQGRGSLEKLLIFVGLVCLFAVAAVRLHSRATFIFQFLCPQGSLVFSIHILSYFKGFQQVLRGSRFFVCFCTISHYFVDPDNEYLKNCRLFKADELFFS